MREEKKEEMLVDEEDEIRTYIENTRRSPGIHRNPRGGGGGEMQPIRVQYCVPNRRRTPIVSSSSRDDDDMKPYSISMGPRTVWIGIRTSVGRTIRSSISTLFKNFVLDTRWTAALPIYLLCATVAAVVHWMFFDVRTAVVVAVFPLLLGAVQIIRSPNMRMPKNTTRACAIVTCVLMTQTFASYFSVARGGACPYDPVYLIADFLGAFSLIRPLFVTATGDRRSAEASLASGWIRFLGITIACLVPEFWALRRLSEKTAWVPTFMASYDSTVAIVGMRLTATNREWSECLGIFAILGAVALAYAPFALIGATIVPLLLCKNGCDGSNPCSEGRMFATCGTLSLIPGAVCVFVATKEFIRKLRSERGLTIHYEQSPMYRMGYNSRVVRIAQVS